ncbi:hypothetical protein ACHAPM_008216 [Fusarium culmorum]|uniref:Uncharacterized protein n=1 Tax=Fusarium culmorum TaxID=5516 RepID=A0A2T4H9B8_FUSCU|nr:hypothetical protein FCULG_00004358 [Fusarium culmorum]
MNQASRERARAIIEANLQPRPPLTLNDTTRQLYERAVADPSSLSEEEQRRILKRLPREEEDSLCHEIYGFTMSELVAKAVQDPDSLSYQESNLLTSTTLIGGKKEMPGESLRLVRADMDLRHRASKASMTVDEIAAEKAGWAKKSAQYSACNAAREALSGPDFLTIKNALVHVPWQDHIMNSSASTKTLAPCGFVVFYPKDQGTDWSTFKEQVDKFVSHGFHRCLTLVKEPIMRGFKSHGIPHDCSESLQSHFVAMRDAGGIPAGLRQDAFLYVDEEAFQSLNSYRPFVWLWEPQVQSAPQKQLGPVMVDIKHVVPLLLIRLTQRDMSLEGRQLKMWRCAPDLKGFHAAAAESTSLHSAERDGIWPPRTLAM